MKRLLVLALLLTATAWAKPPVQRPVNNPRPGRTAVVAPLPAKLLVATGVISTRTSDRIVLNSSKGGKLTFLTNQKTRINGPLKAGQKVAISYDGTLEVGVYKALLVKATK